MRRASRPKTGSQSVLRLTWNVLKIAFPFWLFSCLFFFLLCGKPLCGEVWGQQNPRPKRRAARVWDLISSTKEVSKLSSLPKIPTRKLPQIDEGDPSGTGFLLLRTSLVVACSLIISLSLSLSFPRKQFWWGRCLGSHICLFAVCARKKWKNVLLS